MSGDSTTLAPNASSQFTATYVVTQTDIDAGGLSNTATVVGTPASGGSDVTDVTDDGDTGSGDTGADPTVTSFTASPAVTGLKTVSLTTDADGSGDISAGDTLEYTITAKNTGNVTLTSVSIQSDDLSRGVATLSPVSGFGASNFTIVDGGSDTLLPGAFVSFAAEYVVTEDDIIAGGLSNTATVVGTTPQGSFVTDITDNDNENTGSEGSGPGKDDPTLATLQPLAMDDQSYGNVLGNDVTVSVLLNDSYLGATNPIVKLLDGDAFVSSLTVSGEGIWTVNGDNTVTFSPDPSFVGDPTPVGYNIDSENVADSNRATIFIDYLGVKTADELVAKDDELVGQDPSGPVTLDPLRNDANGSTTDLDRSTVRLLEANGDRQTSLVIPGEGVWNVNTSTGHVTFTPEVGFSGSNVSARYYVENQDGLPQTAVIKILFIDPRGVVYDSDTLQPIYGVELKFADANGNFLADTCFPAGQQPQTTGTDGRYRFDLSVACTTVAGQEFQILITNSNGYSLTPVSDFKQSGPLDPGTPSTDIFEVVAYDDAPTASQTRSYYMSFLLGVNSRQVVNNHIPLRKLSLEIEDDLRNVLRDDLIATMRQQGRQMAGYAEGALKRLKDNSSTACSSAISDQLAKSPILFETGSSRILPESNTTLDVIADLLDQCSQTSFDVEGHTDNRGSVSYNDALSKARAKAVVASLEQRGVPSVQLSAKGYGELRPIAENDTPEGLAMNRRVVFTALADQDSQTCQDRTELERSLDLKIDQDGASGDGQFFKESEDCASRSWTTWQGALTYLKTDTGMAQGMLNVTRRKERLLDQDSLYGYFIGAYGTKNDVSGLATGSIKGFGLTAGAYGAERAANGLFFDYYLGASTGRHNFDLDFERTSGVVNARGHYDYFAAFAGASVSGETSLGDYKLVPRAGLETAWSPGGEAEYEASREVIEDVGTLSTGKVTGARMFVELRFDDLTPKQSGKVAITPKIFCDQPLGGGDKLCGAGASIELSSDEVDGQGRYTFGIEGERTHNSHSLGVSVEYAAPVWEGELSTTSTVSSQGSLSLGMNYERQF